MADQRLTTSRFFDRDAWRAWSPLLYHGVEAQVPSAVLARFSGDVEPGWIEWLQVETRRTTGREVDLLDGATNTLRDHFLGIRMFHATRLSSLKSIAEHGFIAWDTPRLVEQARAQFGTVVGEAELDAAIARALPKDRAGRVYCYSALSIALDGHDENGAQGRVPEFAMQGGEWLRAVAANLGVELVTAPTKGYLFALDIGWDRYSLEAQRDVARHALGASLIATRLNVGDFRMASGMDCLAVGGDIPPASIVAFSETDSVQGVPVHPDDLRWTPWQA